MLPVSNKEELLDSMMDRGTGKTLSGIKGIIFDYNAEENKFYYSPVQEALPREITLEKAIEVFNNLFAVKPEVNVIEEESLEYDVNTVRLFDVVAVSPNKELTLTVIGSPEFQAEYSRLQGAIAQLDDIKKMVDAEIKTLMEARYLHDGVTKIEGTAFNMSFIPESFRERFDMKAFEEAEPELAARIKETYTAISKVSASLRVSKKKVIG